MDVENVVVIDAGVPDEISAASAVENPNKREEDAQTAAAKIIRHAERQAEGIVSDAIMAAAQKQAAIQKQAESDATKLLGESRENGYNEGMAAATAEGDKIKAEAHQLLEAAKAEQKAMQENLEPEIVNMIISITEKILGDTAKINPAVILNIVRQGFAATTVSGNVTVYVSADDYDEVVAGKDELLSFADGSVKLEITKDLSLSSMDCIIETPFGNVDCSLGQQFEAIRTNLTYILNTNK